MSAGYDDDRVQLFTFSVPGLLNTDLAITQHEVVAISGLPDVTPIPLTPPHVLGISTWQEKVLAVVDLAALLNHHEGLSSRPQPSGHYLVCRTVGDNGSELLAWPILSDAHVLAAPGEVSTGDLPEEFNSSAFHAVLDLSGQQLLLLNLSSLAASAS